MYQLWVEASARKGLKIIRSHSIFPLLWAFEKMPQTLQLISQHSPEHHTHNALSSSKKFIYISDDEGNFNNNNNNNNNNVHAILIIIKPFHP